MITTNVLQRTFQLRYGNETGTCFTLDNDGRQYLVTAKHCLQGFTGGVVHIFHDGNWLDINASLVGHGSEDTDITVFSTDFQLSPVYPLKPTIANLAVGQDVHFLGFPFGLKAEVGDLNRQFPLPLIKRATLSAILFEEPKRTLLLDGLNNPGFSGGPVVYNRVGGSNTDLYVASVISAYRFNPEPVHLNNAETGLRYHANTGIIISYSIQHALDAIEANPIGFELSSA